MEKADISVSEIRDLLSQIRGIESVEIRQGPSGGIEGIEIAISPPTAERRVIRDVESALMSGLGIHVDHRAISIHRTNGEPELAPRGNGGSSTESPFVPPSGAAKSLAARFMQPAGVYEE